MATMFGVGLGSNLVKECVMSIFGSIKQQVLYVFKYKSYINDLKDQVEKLSHQRQRLELGVDHARRQGEEIYEDVGKWVEDVKRFIEQEANPITENEGQAGTCSLITRYKVGRKAVKASKAGSNLLGKDFSDVSYRPALQRIESMYVDRGYEAFDSRESVLAEIMEALKDPQVNRIGVYGMGGVGKTTLVKKVTGKAMEDKLFDDVIMAEVTQKPDYKRIQEKIAYDLGLEFGQHESEFQRAGRIRNKLKKGKRVLIILDNIWAKPDLEAIGIPLENDREKRIRAHGKEDYKGINDAQRLYKIVVTSRRLDLLRNYMNTSNNFFVGTLSNEEAQNLFWKIVGLVEKTGCRGIAEEIVEKCGGLPLAVATIANALKNKDLYVWEDALGKLKASNPRSIPEMNENVFSVIELSFNLLNSDEAKSLLLLVSLVDASDGMSLDYLLRYGMGLRLFTDVYTLEQGRKRVATLVNDLKASCLLLEGHNKTWVKMHEVVHAIGESIASIEKLMFNIQDVPDISSVLQEKIFKNPTAISLPYRDICELPERLECSKLNLLFLFMNSYLLTIPKDFFEGVKELKVIDFDHVNLLSVPSSFGYLTNLRTLCLDECLLGDMSMIGELRNLEILSFSRSNIKLLPKEIGQLTRLQLLDLCNCSSLKVIPANVISRLSRLEELNLYNSFVQWENGLNNGDGCNANLVELNQLSRLTTLRICIPDAQIIPPNLFIQQLTRFRILIGDVRDWSRPIEASKTLKLKLNDINYLGYKLIKRLLKITEDLFLYELNGIQNVLYKLDEEGFPNLKYLHVQNSPELRYIVNSVGQIRHDAFMMLEVLFLSNLSNLVEICHSPLGQASFNKLKVIKVNKCVALKNLFSISMAKSLSQLQEIDVTDCENLQVIFVGEDDEGHMDNGSESSSKIKFNQLRFLTLKFLPQFTSFSFNVKTRMVSQVEIITEDDPEDFKSLFGKRVEFPSLEYLTLSSINTEKISAMDASCPTLRSLEVEACSGLKFLFSSLMVESWMQLQYLMISKCESMKEIIDRKELEGEATIIFTRQLSLWLKDLPKLTRFSIGNSIEFPLLNDLAIDNCPNLRTFFPNSTCETTKNKLEDMNLEQTIEPLFGETVGLPSVESLTIFKMDNLRKIWDDELSSDSFCKLQTLMLMDCNKLLNIFPFSMFGRLYRLDTLKIGSCASLEEIFEFQALSDQQPYATIATQLRELHLVDLPKLKHIWNMNAQEIPAFQNLIKIRIHSCDGLKSLFPASIAKGLLKLEELEIVGSQMNEIIAKKEREVEEAVIPQFSFPRLSSLQLSLMLDLKTFYPEKHISEWPILEKMKVFKCSSIQILSSELQSHQHGESQFDHLQALFLTDKGAFPNLRELEVSTMDMLLHLWEENSQSTRVFQNLENLKVSRCPSLKNLVPSTASLHNLQTLEIIECDKLINLVTLSTASVQLQDLKECKCESMEEVIGTTGLGREAIISFPNLCFLELRDLPKLTRFGIGKLIEFPSLSQLQICNCPNLTTLFVNSTCERNEMYSKQNIQPLFGEKIAVPNLEKLEVCKMDNLRKIWDDQLTSNSFSKLRDLRIEDCCELKNIFPSIMLGRLQALCSFIVSNCESLEEIFENAAKEEVAAETVLRFVFPQLTSLSLKELPALKSFYPGIHISDWPVLKKLEIYRCDQVKIFASELFQIDAESQHDIPSQQTLFLVDMIVSPALEKISSCFQNLTILRLDGCDNLTYVFTASVVESFAHLEFLRISNCNFIDRVIVIDKERKSARAFPKLELLQLNDLPRLKSFCNFTGDLIELFSLSTLVIDNCPNMETFVSNSVCANTTRNEPEEMNSENTHHAHTQPLFDNKVSLHNLKKLIVWNMDNLRKIWDDDQLNLDSFNKLSLVSVGSCNRLLHIFPSIMHGRLQRLELLKVRNCDSLQEILELEALGGQDEIVFRKLEYLELVCLAKLRSFCWGKCTLKFPSLDQVIAKECSKMESFSRGILSTPKLRTLQLTEEGDAGCWEGDLNTTTQHLFKEMNSLTSEQD